MVAPQDMVGTIMKLGQDGEVLLDELMGEGAEAVVYSITPLDDNSPFANTVIKLFKPQPFLEMRALHHTFRVDSLRYPDHPLAMEPARRLELLVDEMLERVRSPRLEYRINLYRGLLQTTLTVLVEQFSEPFDQARLPDNFLESIPIIRLRTDENLLHEIEEALDEDNLNEDYVPFFEFVTQEIRRSIASWKSQGSYSPLSSNPLYNLLGLAIENFIDHAELEHIRDHASFRALIDFEHLEGLFHFICTLYFRAVSYFEMLADLPSLSNPDDEDDNVQVGSEAREFRENYEKVRRNMYKHAIAGIIGCTLMESVAADPRWNSAWYCGLAKLWHAKLMRLDDQAEETVRERLLASLEDLTETEALRDRHDVYLELASLPSMTPSQIKEYVESAWEIERQLGLR